MGVFATPVSVVTFAALFLCFVDCVFRGYEQKWSKGKTREKAQNEILFKQETYERLLAETPKVHIAA